jgi:manganese-dependent inorganic pyrophosphatase
VAAAFNEKFDANDRLALPGVVSRKKQVVPPMQGAFEG